MKHSILDRLPNKLFRSIQRMTWTFRTWANKSDFTAEQYNRLDALKCQVAYNKFGGYCVPLSSRHRGAARQILAKKVHEPETLAFMMNRREYGDIVHAGAYFGDFLPALSASCNDHSKIWAFEPNKENYLCAKLTSEINYLSNVELRNAALGERNESATLIIKNPNGQALGGGSRIVKDKDSIRLQETEAIRLCTIDSTIGSDRKVAIIQLDVEGYEKEALCGGLKTIRRCHPILILERLNNDPFFETRWFSENILDLGYVETAKLHGNIVFEYVGHRVA